jgi:hypothetical protein
MTEIALHFQEGFSGETVQILVNGEPIGERSLKTRNQIGLAHIERIEVSSGDQIELKISGLSDTKVKITGDASSIKINLVDKKLIAEQTNEELRYL